MNDIQSLFFYIIVFFTSCFFYYEYSKTDKKIYLLCSFAILVIIGGLRNNVGTDYNNYIILYENGSKVDFGFFIISKISSYFNGYRTMFFIYNMLTLLFVYLGLENLKDKEKPIALFIYLFLYYTTSFNIIRQALAIGIIFYSYKYIINKKLIKWISFVVLASLFHSTALLTLPFYFVVNSENKIIKILNLFLIFLVSYFYIDVLELLSNLNIFSHYALYIEYNSSTFYNRMFFLNMIVMIYVLFFERKLVDYDSKYRKYIYFFEISFVLMFTGFFNPFVKRIGDYFSISQIIIFSKLPFVCKLNKNRILNLVFVCGYSIIVFIISVYILKQANVIPYSFID